MCQAVSCIQDRVYGFAASAKQLAIASCNYLGRKVDSFKTELVPSCIKTVNDYSLKVLTDYFFVIPGIAFTLGHYQDALLLSTVAFTNWALTDEDARVCISLFLGASVALSLAIRSLDFAACANGFAGVAVALQAICLAKLLLMSKNQIVTS